MIGDSRAISLKVEADARTVVSHEAVSIGLIVTELVMNALKQRIPDRKAGRSYRRFIQSRRH
jgi:chemotaxis protein methyltransferase CheR